MLDYLRPVDQGSVQWTTRDGRSIAFQATGSGRTDLLLLDFWFTNLDSDWDSPANARWLRRLGRSARVIRMDKVGTGLSDRRPPSPDHALEDWADDAVAVLDAAGCDRVGLAGFGWSGPLAITLAARHPERVERLVLSDTFARITSADDHPSGLDPSFMAAGRELLIDRWGSGVMIDLLGMDQEGRARERQARYERSAASRCDLAALADAFISSDARSSLPLIEAPTLVLHRDSPLVDVGQAEHLAAHIPGATLRMLDRSEWSWPVADEDLPEDLLVVLDFLTGTTQERSYRRRLLTIVFLDIVGSTPLLAKHGDREWSDLLSSFTVLLEEQVSSHGGRLVNSAGDGFLLVFDSATDALQFATDLNHEARELAIGVRTGVHTGECEVAGEDLRGMAVHAAARIMALADADDIYVSDVTATLCGSEFSFEAQAPQRLRGVPGEWTLHALATPT